MPAAAKFCRVARAQERDTLLLVPGAQHQSSGELRQKRTVLHQFDCSSHTRGDDPHAVPRAVEHYGPESRMVLSAQFTQLWHHQHYVRRVSPAACDSLVQFIANGSKCLKCGLFVVRIDSCFQEMRNPE
jgi:hypothetical protein